MFSAASTTQLVRTAASEFSVAALIILGSVITIAVGLLVFKWGFWKLVNHTGMGAKLARTGWKWVATADHWSFRGSKEYKRMVGDM